MARDDKWKNEQTYFHLSATGLTLYILPFPLIGFITCIIISIICDFDRATATHCGVKNYLPSISAAIGGFTPQRYIWRICIALHVAPRFMVACMYYSLYMRLRVHSWPRLYNAVVVLAIGLHMFENGALVMLSMISSTENHSIHEGSFISFMVFSLVYMLLSCILMKWGHAADGLSGRAAKAYHWKKVLFLTNFTSFMVAVYFFYRHNAFCEPGVYTLFAFCEYITIITNIFFHGTAAIVFGGGKLAFTAPSEGNKKKT